MTRLELAIIRNFHHIKITIDCGEVAVLPETDQSNQTFYANGNNESLLSFSGSRNILDIIVKLDH